jgi:four helix bundle protein
MGDFTKLAVWKKPHELTVGVYRATASWPRHEMFALISQGASSRLFASCECSGRMWAQSRRGTRKFPRTSLGSASELSYCLE